MLRRRTLFTVVLAGAMALLAACGGGDTETETAAAGDERRPSAEGAAEAEPTGPTIEVDAHDISLSPEEFTVPAGSYTVVYVNQGQLEHTLLIDGAKGLDLLVRSKGEKDSGRVDLEPGAYTFYCDVPGHRAAGMHAELTVQ